MRLRVWVCLVLAVGSVPVFAEEKPARSGYLFFSKGNLPEGTARMAVEEPEKPKTTVRNAKSQTRKVSYEVIDELGYDYPDSLPELDQGDAPTFGTTTLSPLAGTRYTYTYGGRRYSAHCYTAPGYEAACCEPVYALAPCEYYRVKCCRPGLLGCLFGCSQPRCKLVRVRPGLCSHGIYDVRCPTVPVPLYAVDVWTPREITYLPARRRVVETSDLPEDEWDREPIVPASPEQTFEEPAPTPEPFPEGPALTAPGAL